MCTVLYYRLTAGSDRVSDIQFKRAPRLAHSFASRVSDMWLCKKRERDGLSRLKASACKEGHEGKAVGLPEGV